MALEVQEIKRKSKPSLIRLINGKSLSARAIRDILKSIGVDVKTETDEQILDHTPYIKEAAEYSLKALEDFDAYRKGNDASDAPDIDRTDNLENTR